MKLLNVEILEIGEAQEFGANKFKVLEFVVKDDSNTQYPQEIQMQITQDRVENFLKFNKVGQRVDVSLNIKGRSYEKDGVKRWYNTLEAWKVFKAEDVPTEEEGQDLPF